jgi:sulfur carrier protein ThiS
MQISVNNERTNKQQTIEFQKSTVKELLNLINVNPETVLVVRNKEVITESTKLNNLDHLDLLSVISGG